MAMRIYTKTGDAGKTSLLGGVKVLKSHSRIEAYGNVDELNSYLGLCRDQIKDEHTLDVLLKIQHTLFIIGSHLAVDSEKGTAMNLPDINQQHITDLENEIDQMDDALPAMKHFILPGGHAVVSHLHVARCICRRAERSIVFLHETNETVDGLILQYMNRLSDYLFTLARYVGFQSGVAEIPWIP